VIADLLRPDWVGAYATIITAVTIIGVGLCAALLAAHVRWIEHLFLPRIRAHAALNRRARELFLAREFFATPRRNAVLLLGGRFERVVVVYADIAYYGRIGEEGWQLIVDAITPGLARGAVRPAFVAGLEALETLLVDAGFVAQPGDHPTLPDAPLELGDPS
jgi:putative membrane protein